MLLEQKGDGLFLNILEKHFLLALLLSVSIAYLKF